MKVKIHGVGAVSRDFIQHDQAMAFFVELDGTVVNHAKMLPAPMLPSEKGFILQILPCDAMRPGAITQHAPVVEKMISPALTPTHACAVCWRGRPASRLR